MAVTIDEFLRAWQLEGNPFATTNAEQEQQTLPSFFVRVKWFEHLVGKTTEPESFILFAPRGHGKTSHRIEVARLARQRRDNPALVVVFTDFDMLLEAGAAQITLQHYRDVICKRTIEALADELGQRPDFELALRRDRLLAAKFDALLFKFSVLRAYAQGITKGAVEALLESYNQTQLSTKEWLRELAALARQAGFACVYFLIDGVDEWPQTRTNPLAAVALLKPLLDSIGVLQECGFAFKFFLPLDLEPLLLQEHVGRFDRMRIEHLEWTPAELATMLAQRLVSQARGSGTSASALVRTFRDWCAVDYDIDRRLVEAAQTSPRRLLDLARQIIEQHCRQIDDRDAPISDQTILAVLGAPAGASAAPPASVPLLFFDTTGDIWLDSQRLQIKLPNLQRRCMNYLWQHRHRSVSIEELIRAIYDDQSLHERGDPVNSCYKLITRLRERIDPGKLHLNRYIEPLDGVGFVLRNFRNEHPAND